MDSNPHALDMVGPAGSKFPVHHTRKCASDACRGCYPHAKSPAGIAELAMRTPGRGGSVRIRAVVAVSA